MGFRGGGANVSTPFGAPGGPVVLGGGAVAGSAPAVPHADHQHAFPVPANSVLPVQQPRAAQILDSTGGTSEGNVVAGAGALYSQADENNWRATVIAKLNALEAILHNSTVSL